MILLDPSAWQLGALLVGGTAELLRMSLEAFGDAWSRLTLGRACNVLVLGLDGAGKTTLLYRLQADKQVPTFPTIGFNTETFRVGKIEFTVWDIGGDARVRPMWRLYFSRADAIVFVVDSTDRDRLALARSELQRTMHCDELRDAKLLVCANKQDASNAMTVHDVRQQLALDEWSRHTAHVQGIAASTGYGVRDALEWLSHQLLSNER
ncbi:hypothetical protein P43SY_006796 [Pythium insidiosum]|uniref:ADP-ribosylation factor n=1 Tax=Pythium insidiosum TaxID=114742 RepID=A0AAD5LKX6_PYTIN|nr:hypothetical protein P43SY_006796 [Pythium insidiosum]